MDSQFGKSIQILRAFCIALVCLLHALRNLSDPVAGGEYLRIIANAGVVGFFLIAGFLFEWKKSKYNADKGSFIRAKVRKLIVPYLFWSLVLYVGAKIVHHLIGGSLSAMLDNLGFPDLSVLQICRNILFFNEFYIEALWFLYALFVLQVLGLFSGDWAHQIWFILLEIVIAAVLDVSFTLPYMAGKLLKHYSDYAMGRLAAQLWLQASEESTDGAAEATRHAERGGMQLGPKGMLFTVICCLAVGIPLMLLLKGRMSGIIASELIRNVIVTLIEHAFYWDEIFLFLMLAFVLARTRLSESLKAVGDYSYDIYLLHHPYVVPICARVLEAAGIPASINLIITVLLGMGLPMLGSYFVIRRVPVVCDLMLGRPARERERA